MNPNYKLILNGKNPFFRGFTLIELLIVISIIGILSGIVLSVINVPKWQARSRDAVRKEQIAVLAGALERYYADNNEYPRYSGSYRNADSALPASVTTGQPILVPEYIKSVEKDPKGWSYIYTTYNNYQDFCLCGRMESSDSLTVSVPANCPSLPSADYNYCIENTF